jgi:hypothetical protein
MFFERVIVLPGRSDASLAKGHAAPIAAVLVTPDGVRGTEMCFCNLCIVSWFCTAA